MIFIRERQIIDKLLYCHFFGKYLKGQFIVKYRAKFFEISDCIQ